VINGRRRYLGVAAREEHIHRGVMNPMPNDNGTRVNEINPHRPHLGPYCRRCAVADDGRTPGTIEKPTGGLTNTLCPYLTAYAQSMPDESSRYRKKRATPDAQRRRRSMCVDDT